MKIKVNYPIKCRVDNIGAIFMSQNVTTTSRAKHIDIRTKFVREYVEDGKIKIVFVRSGDNDSDIMTKNVQGDLHDKHSKKLIGKQHWTENAHGIFAKCLNCEAYWVRLPQSRWKSTATLMMLESNWIVTMINHKGRVLEYVDHHVCDIYPSKESRLLMHAVCDWHWQWHTRSLSIMFQSHDR